MKMINVEVVAVDQVNSTEVEAACRELSDVELALIGGGSGDITLG